MQRGLMDFKATRRFRSASAKDSCYLRAARMRTNLGHAQTEIGQSLDEQ
jgi:hypothetical protein